MKKYRQSIWFLVLCLVAWYEMRLTGDLQNHDGIFYSPLQLFLLSLSVSLLALKAPFRLDTYVSASSVTKWIPVIILLPALVWLFKEATSILEMRPINFNDSDIIAQVLAPSQSLLKGEWPYQDVVLPTYTMHNTYLPMQWLPFVIPVAFNFDPRWLPVFAWSIAILIFYGTLVRKISFSSFITIPAIVLVIYLSLYGIHSFMKYNSFDFQVSVELLPAAYYLILIVALLSGNSWLIGVSLGTCLMSRFSIILLVPFLAWYIWRRYGLKKWIQAAVATVFFCTIVFVLPFMTRDTQLPFKIVGNYNSGAFNEWHTHSWQEPGAEPHQLARGLGLAIFVKKMYEYDIREGINHLKNGSIITCLCIGLFLIYLFERNRNSIHADWFLLGGIKLYFSFFYALVLIPYPYLFLLPMTITIAILAKALSQVLQQPEIQ